MSESFLKDLLRKTAIVMAHAWVWGIWLANKQLPEGFIRFSVYNKDIEHKDFEGKKVVITLEVWDE